MLGRADVARKRVSNAVAVADLINSPFELATAHYIAAWLQIYLKAPEQAETSATQSLSLAEEYGFPQVAAFARIALGRAQASLGHPAEGIVKIRRGLSELAQTDTRNTTTQLLSWLAEAQSFGGATTEALETVEEALNANPEELAWRPDALRVRAGLRLKLGQTGAAQADFRDAIALAQKTNAKAWELRAAIGLAQILEARGDVVAARQLLSPLYDSFAEGFDTADLKEAKALLDELNE